MKKVEIVHLYDGVGDLRDGAASFYEFQIKFNSEVGL